MNYFFNYKQIWFFLLISLVVNNSSILAQKTKKTSKTKKEVKVKPAKNGNSQAAIQVQMHGLSKEDKDILAHCPLHNKRMGLSDNYRADASDYIPGDSYPFAYQLNYRRYCMACTKVMAKEMRLENAGNKKGDLSDSSFERCAIHNNGLKGNPDYNKADFEKNPAADMLHAKQYKAKYYCVTCTKVYKIQFD